MSIKQTSLKQKIVNFKFKIRNDSFIVAVCSALTYHELLKKKIGTVCMPYFRLARDPTAAALADPYLGQSIGPVPGYGVSFIIYIFYLFLFNLLFLF